MSKNFINKIDIVDVLIMNHRSKTTSY